MIKSRLAYAGLLLTLVAVPAFAQTASPSAPTPPAAPSTPAAAAVATDAAQQQQIEQGLKSGQLTAKEAGKLEQGEKRIDNAEARDLKKDGSSGLTTQQQQQLTNMQNKEESRIQKLDTNAKAGDPNSASSKRMQEDVQRNVNQENRIENGMNNGTLTNREAGRMEKGQARVDRAEARAARNGHVGAKEQARVQRDENRQSGRIYRAKHNRRNAPGAEAPAAPAAPVAQ